MSERVKKILMLAVGAVALFAVGYTAGRYSAPDKTKTLVEQVAEAQEKIQRQEEEKWQLISSIMETRKTLDERTKELETLKKVKKTVKEHRQETKPDGGVIIVDREENEESEEVSKLHEETKRLTESLTLFQEENRTLKLYLQDEIRTSVATRTDLEETYHYHAKTVASRFLVGAGYGLPVVGKGWGLDHVSLEMRVIDRQLQLPVVGNILGPVYVGGAVTATGGVMGTVRIGLF